MEINQPKAVQLVAYGSDTLSTLGTTNFDCHLKCTKRNLEFRVVDRPVTPLLGLAESLCMGLVQLHSEVHEVDIVNKQPFLTNAMVYLKAILVLNLPVLNKIRLDRNSTPVGRPPRKVPLAIEECVKRKLEGMVKIGAITPVSEPTEWVSQMVAARKKDGSIRICIDTQLRSQQSPQKSSTIPCDQSKMLPPACLIPQYSQLLILGVVSSFFFLLSSQPSAHRSGDTDSSSCRLVLHLHRKFSSAQWKSCLLGIPVLSSWMTYWYGEKELWNMMSILGKFYRDGVKAI